MLCVLSSPLPPTFLCCCGSWAFFPSLSRVRVYSRGVAPQPCVTQQDAFREGAVGQLPSAKKNTHKKTGSSHVPVIADTCGALSVPVTIELFTAGTLCLLGRARVHYLLLVSSSSQHSLAGAFCYGASQRLLAEVHALGCPSPCVCYDVYVREQLCCASPIVSAAAPRHTISLSLRHVCSAVLALALPQRIARLRCFTHRLAAAVSPRCRMRCVGPGLSLAVYLSLPPVFLPPPLSVTHPPPHTFFFPVPIIDAHWESDSLLGVGGRLGVLLFCVPCYADADVDLVFPPSLRTLSPSPLSALYDVLKVDKEEGTWTVLDSCVAS